MYPYLPPLPIAPPPYPYARAMYRDAPLPYPHGPFARMLRAPSLANVTTYDDAVRLWRFSLQSPGHKPDETSEMFEVGRKLAGLASRVDALRALYELRARRYAEAMALAERAYEADDAWTGWRNEFRVFVMRSAG